MPIHDWTLVNAGTFHDFHNAWIIHLKEVLNGGLLPRGYYAMSEQHAGRVVADILTLHVGDRPAFDASDPSAVAVLEAAPRVRRKAVMSENATYRTLRRSLAIRHVSRHRLVCLLEILSPANEDRPASVRDFVEKAHAALQHGCHLLVIDLFPSGSFDPQGMHEAIWADLRDPSDELPPPDKPLTLAAYEAAFLWAAYIEPVAVGDALPEMPLFLQPGRYINVPLEATYEQADRGMSAFWRDVLEGREPPPT